MTPVSAAALVLGSLSAGLLSWAATDWFLNHKAPLPFRPFLKITGGRPKFYSITIGILTASLIALLWRGASGGGLVGLGLLSAWFLTARIPAWKKRYGLNQGLARMRNLFPQALGMAIQALKTGRTLPQVLEFLSLESPAPLREEWRRVHSEMELGSSAEQALDKMTRRFPDFQELDQFLQSYKISRTTGANLTQLLQVLLEGLEEKNRILRKRESMTAQARLSGLLVGLLPFLLGAAFFLADPGLILPLFREKIGWGILTLSALLEAIGFLWIRSLLRLEV